MSTTNSMVTYVGGTSWTRNTNCIVSSTSGYDTTGISTGINLYGGIGATLISNRHVLLANHTAPGNTAGSTVYFVNEANTTFTYTISSVGMVGPYGQGYTDISIGYLNTTIDPSLTYYSVFPSTFEDYIQTTVYASYRKDLNTPMPLFYMDQEKKFLCGDLKYIFLNDGTPSWLSDKLGLIFSNDTERYNNSEALVGGDSGNALFAPINGELVLMGANYESFTYVKTAQGTSMGTTSCLYKHISDINSVMTSLAGTSYSLTEINMSSFANYS